MTRNKKISLRILTVMIVGILLCSFLTTGASASSNALFDEAADGSSAYTEYPLDNYKLDFYVDTSGGWLPWNWTSNISSTFESAIYGITDALWWISRVASYGMGYLVQEAYNLDFISETAEAIGANIQTLAGISPAGFSRDGFWPGMLLILVFVMGIYAAYVGLIKRETTKVVSALVNCLLIFVIGAGFIAYAPDCIKKINEFSVETSNGALDLGTKITLSDAGEGSSINALRASMFGIQIEQPWLLMQFGTTDISTLVDGEERVNALLSASTSEEREAVVINEVDNYGNENMSVTKVASRLGTAILFLIMNCIISIFMILLVAQMLLSQVMFLIFVTMLPFCLLLSMFPGCNGLARLGVESVFNALMKRLGYTVIITVAFSLSSLLYQFSGTLPLIFIMFLQIVVFAGIYMLQHELLRMLSLNGGNEKNIAHRMQHSVRRMSMMTRRTSRGISRGVGRAAAAVAGGTGRASGNARGNVGSGSKDTHAGGEARGRGNTAQAAASGSNTQPEKQPLSARLGRAVGTAKDIPSRMVSGVTSAARKVADVPVHARYAVQQGKKKAASGVSAFGRSVAKTQADNKTRRASASAQYDTKVADKRDALQTKSGEAVRKPAQVRGNVSASGSSAAMNTPVSGGNPPDNHKNRPDERAAGRSVEKESGRNPASDHKQTREERGNVSDNATPSKGARPASTNPSTHERDNLPISSHAERVQRDTPPSNEPGNISPSARRAEVPPRSDLTQGRGNVPASRTHEPRLSADDAGKRYILNGEVQTADKANHSDRDHSDSTGRGRKGSKKK